MRDDFNDLLQRLLQRFPDSFGARAADIRQRHWQAEQILEAVLPELQVSPSQRSRIGGHLFKGHKVFANEVQAAIGRCPDAFAKLSLATPAVATHLARAGAYQALGGFLGRLHRRAADHQQLEMACAVRIALEVHEEVKAQARCRQPSAEARRGMQALQVASSILAGLRRRPGRSA